MNSAADKAPTVASELPSNSKSFTILLPYTRQKGENLMKSLRKDIHPTLPKNGQTRICYTGTKLATKFNNIEDPIKKYHQHGVVYYATSSKPGGVKGYTGETSIRLNKSVADLNEKKRKDTSSNTRKKVIVPECTE